MHFGMGRRGPIFIVAIVFYSVSVIDQVHQQTECQPVAGRASDDDADDMTDSTDVLQYVTDADQLQSDDAQLIGANSEPMSASSSDYKVFVTGSHGEQQPGSAV